MMRFRLRTLVILLAIGPMVAGVWFHRSGFFDLASISSALLSAGTLMIIAGAGFLAAPLIGSLGNGG